MATIRKVVVNLTAGTAELFDGIDKSNAKIGQFGQNVRNAHGQVVSSTMAASGAIRLLEGNFTNNIRAVEKFVAVTLGLGPALQAAFGVVGALATVGIFVKMGEEAYKFFKQIEDGPRRIAQAFRDLETPVRNTNDQLALTKAVLDNTIAKLSGKPQNGMKVAILEAVAAADQLSDSLDKDLRKIAEVLTKEKVGWLARAGGATSSNEIRDIIGGAEGHGHGLTEKLQEIERVEHRELLAAKNISDQKRSIAATEAAEQRANDSRQAELGKAKNKIGVIAARESAKQITERSMEAEGVMLPGTGGESKIHQEAIAAMAELEDLKTSIDLQQGVTGDKRKIAELQADNSNNRLEKPAEDKINAMKAQIVELRAKMASVGQTDAFKGLIEGHANAIKAIEQVNKALERFHGNKAGNYISAKDAAEITDLAMSEKQIEVETAYQSKLHATNLSISERIASLYQLGNAMNKGYEATRNAGVEIELRKSFGDRYNDPDARVQSDIEANRQKLRQAADKDHSNQTLGATTSLGKQIELEKSLLAVQEQGAEVIARVTLAYRLRDLARNGASALQIQQEVTKFETEQARLTKAELTTIEDKIKATRALTAAAADGVEAQRKAGLEAKYAQMAAHGNADLVPATRTADEGEHQLKITDEATKTANVYRDQLFLVNQQIEATRLLRKTSADQLGVETSLKNLEDQRLTIAANQALAMRRAQDGVRAFFLEMQRQGESTAKIVYDALNSAVDKLSDNLSKAMTGQKAAWGDMFKSIGTDLLKAELKKEISKGLGDIGKLFGIGAKRDGSAQDQALWVQLAGGPQGVGTGAGGQVIPGIVGVTGQPSSGGTGGGGGLFGDGSLGGGIFSFLKKNSGSGNILSQLGDIFHGSMGAGTFDPSASAFDAFATGAGNFAGMFAGGGNIPSGSYGIAGEAGPEKVFGPANVMSNRDSFGNGGDQTHNHYYTIDNRGAELGSENRMRAMLKEVHSSAVSNSVRANAERTKRQPQRTR